MTDEVTRLIVQISADAEGNAAELDGLTQKLRRQILELDVHSAEPLRVGNAPNGAKGDPVTVGAIVIALAASGSVLPKLIELLQTWATRERGHNVKVKVGDDEIDIPPVTSKLQNEAVRAFLRRHEKAS